MAYKIPALNNLQAYIKAVMKLPSLELDQEKTATKEELVLSHLKLVVALSSKYSSNSFREDLIQEGNIALIRCAETFDPNNGTHFSYYATQTIKYAMMHNNIDMVSPIKMITTRSLKKAYFNLPKYRIDGKPLSSTVAKQMATDLNIEVQDIRDIEQRLYTTYEYLDVERDSDDSRTPYELVDHSDPANIIADKNYEQTVSRELPKALDKLSEREREIIKRRWLSDSPSILQELGDEYGVSGERIRQIENNALKKMKTMLELVDLR